MKIRSATNRVNRLVSVQVEGEGVGAARHRHAAVGQTLRDGGTTQDRGVRHHGGRCDGNTTGHFVDEVRDDRHIQAKRVQDAQKGTRSECR